MGVTEEEDFPALKRPKLACQSSEQRETSSLSSPSSPSLSSFPSFLTSVPGASAMAGKSGGRGDSSSSPSPSPPSDSERIGSNNQIRKTEFVRLITQALYSLGYSNTAQRLEEESQISLQSSAVTDFRNGILSGKWDECVHHLTLMQVSSEETLKNAKFFILQQNFLELLENSKTAEALGVLRLHLAPLGIHTKRVHLLASWVMCTTKEDLYTKSQWSGSGGDSRYRLLVDLQNLLPPSIMIPEKRLERLVEQALQIQRDNCSFHNTLDQAFSLFFDHSCGREQIPSETTQVLEDHTDEVWYLHFSHDGTQLASASKDQTVIIWEVGDGESAHVKHRLVGHTNALSFVAWSPDDTRLLTCGNDNLVKLWNTLTGQCLRTYVKHTAHVTSCAWFPDGRRFVSGGLDKCMYMWDVEGNELESWSGSEMPRVNDLAISDDGKHMVSICNEKVIRIYGFEDKVTHQIPETQSITSLAMSSDGRCLLVNLSSGFIHLWDGIDSKKPPASPAFKYEGQVQGRFVIRSCFGGSEQGFILSGSEDSQVYIWHRESGELLEVLPGHSGTVNAVSWNPKHPHMFASASDDRTVRLWGLTKDKRQCKGRVAGNGAETSALNGIKEKENGW